MFALSDLADVGFPTGIVALTLWFGVFRWNSSRNNARHLPLPPGPPRKYFVGNINQVPTSGYEWLAYDKLAKVYGDLIYFSGLGNSVLSINSYKVANDLLDKRGAIYSDRPRLPMVKELFGWAWNLIIMSYSEGFAEHRKLVQQSFQPQIVTSYRPVVVREVGVLLKNLMTKPDDFYDHLKSMAGAIIMMITYGHQVDSMEDEFIQLAEKVRETATTSPGSQLVDLLPILKYTPSWFPGQQFARHAVYVRSLSHDMRTRPYQQVQAQMAAGTARSSLTSKLIEEHVTPTDHSKEDLIKNVAGVIYSAGADTVVTALVHFFLAMMQYPEVQERARQELYSVVGHNRLPEFHDRKDLPYVSALVKELLRWKPIAPLGVVHCTADVDEYQGQYIPKGTSVIPNIAAMLHDKDVYPCPDNFDPTRFLGDQPSPDPARAAFGFGRRVCPGRYFADESMFLAIACILHTFHISHPVDTEGRPVDLKIEWSSGLVAVPSYFPCIIQPLPETRKLVIDAILD
ncbi:cytochrome P450 [Cristinia sonorae]|uniref:Cytochrome P450 n=1 Tax=Cristinia sonorae TaxID=1940300 RepID=A0A8K0UML1_9AGAR|nr:cytochrome P450 [Cristinia sonorae]